LDRGFTDKVFQVGTCSISVIRKEVTEGRRKLHREEFRKG